MEMEENGKVVKGGGDATREGNGVVKMQDYPNPLMAPSSALASILLEGNKTEEGRQEGDGVLAKMQHVAMGMDVLDCPVCSTPLSPPIFQCSMGHVVCSACRDKLPAKACSVCSRTVLNRCHGMERVVASIVVPCPYAPHGCADVIAYHQKTI